MNGFDEREKGFEARFRQDQELRFRVTVRRNKLFGLWAAGRLGLAPGEPTEEYARSVVAADFELPGDDDVIAKVRGDLAAEGIEADPASLRAELTRAAIEARRQCAET